MKQFTVPISAIFPLWLHCADISIGGDGGLPGSSSADASSSADGAPMEMTASGEEAGAGVQRGADELCAVDETGAVPLTVLDAAAGRVKPARCGAKTALVVLQCPVVAAPLISAETRDRLRLRPPPHFAEKSERYRRPEQRERVPQAAVPASSVPVRCVMD